MIFFGECEIKWKLATNAVITWSIRVHTETYKVSLEYIQKWFLLIWDNWCSVGRCTRISTLKNIMTFLFINNEIYGIISISYRWTILYLYMWWKMLDFVRDFFFIENGFRTIVLVKWAKQFSQMLYFVNITYYSSLMLKINRKLS